MLRTLVGVSVLAIAVHQWQMCWLTHRYREQAHSYTVLFRRWIGNEKGTMMAIQFQLS
jgi:hypothetical protein